MNTLSGSHTKLEKLVKDQGLRRDLQIQQQLENMECAKILYSLHQLIPFIEKMNFCHF